MQLKKELIFGTIARVRDSSSNNCLSTPTFCVPVRATAEAQTQLQNASDLAVINADSPLERPKNYGTDIAPLIDIKL